MTKRYLPRNDGTEGPSNLIFFDTECNRVPAKDRPGSALLTLRLWCATRVRLEAGKRTRRKEAWGQDAESFWRFIDASATAGRRTWVFAHNLAFDLTQVGFWHKLDDGTFTVEPLHRKPKPGQDQGEVSWRGRICAERCPVFFVVRNGRRMFHFVDTMNYWRKGLANIGRDFKLTKLDMPAWEASDEAWRIYCQQDVRIIEEAVCSLVETWLKEDCGVFRETAPALAMQNFMHTCPVRTPDGRSVDIVCNPGGKEHELEREAYYGGRVQCFYVGTHVGRVYHLDVNSLYPMVMAYNLFPRRYAGFAENITNEELASKMACYLCCARVAISSTDQTFPIRIGGVQYHACGDFHTTLCGAELLRAMESDCISRVHRVQWYSGAELFTDYVERWYSRKLAASPNRDNRPGDYEFAKLMLNSLSGKFAQHGRRWEDVPGMIPAERWGAWVELDGSRPGGTNYRGIGALTQKLVTDKEPKHSFPLISAFITAFGRHYMDMIIAACPAGSVLYMATDSVIVTQEGYHALERDGWIHPERIGKLRIVDIADDCTIRCCNHYTIGPKTVAAGLIGKAYQAGRDDGRVEVFEGMPSLIAGAPKNSVAVSEVFVSDGVPIYKGFIRPDGYWRPYQLPADWDSLASAAAVSDRLGYSSDTQADRTAPAVAASPPA